MVEDVTGAIEYVDYWMKTNCDYPHNKGVRKAIELLREFVVVQKAIVLVRERLQDQEFDPSRPFRTRDGREVWDFNVSAGYPRGIVSGEGPMGWRNDGHVSANGEHPLDLVNDRTPSPLPRSAL